MHKTIAKYADEKQANLWTRMPQGTFLANQHNMHHFLLWNTFFRRNIHRFIIDYLGIALYLYQIIIVYLLNICPRICIVAARSAAKSFIIAVFTCAKAILYPNSRIVIVSSNLAQSSLIITQKIQIELYNKSAALRKNIKKIGTTKQGWDFVSFHNGSTIMVVPASENARGNRSTLIIYEEARMIPKAIINSIIEPFQIIRQADFLTSDVEYGNMKELHEEPISIYISSSWMQNHWFIQDVSLNYLDKMIEGKNAITIALDYSITLKHNIKTYSFIAEQKEKLDPMTFAIEYENLCPAQNTSAYYSFDIINQNQTIKRAFYPRTAIDYIGKIKNPYGIPKQKGEIRIVSCDLATIDRPNNDNTSIECLRLLPETFTNSKGTQIQDYRIQVPYLDAFKGKETTSQAVRIRQIYEDFDSDYIVMDAGAGGSGVSVYDALAKVLYDDERNVEYSPLSCMNDDAIANRIKNPNASPVIYMLHGSLRLNNEMAANLKTLLINKKIDFLVDKIDAEEEIRKLVADYYSLTPAEQMRLEKPYLETMLMVHELVNLEYEVMESTKVVRLKEKSGMCKDRYSGLAMGCYFANLLARDLQRVTDEIKIEQAPICVSTINF